MTNPMRKGNKKMLEIKIFSEFTIENASKII